MKELKFIHITKNAGHFIEELGRKHGIEWGVYHKDSYITRGVDPSSFTISTQIHHIFCEKPEFIKAKYDWFLVVRNPYTRLLSEYYCRGGGVGKCKVNHDKHTFNKYLMEKITNRYKFYPTKYGHYVEQYRYLDPAHTIHIIKYENMYNELKSLFSNYNLDINLDNYIDQKINSKESHRNDITFTINDFSPILIKFINAIYDKDFQTFNYDKIVV
jgi:hypothetical protein